MTSLDIDALFTNIPLYQTIDIWVKKLLKTQDTLAKGKSKNDIRDLLNFATKESFFLFNNNFYIQVDGLIYIVPVQVISRLPLLAADYRTFAF